VSGTLDLAFAAGGQLVMAGGGPNSLAIAGDGAIYAASSDGTNHLVQVQRIQ
jgi:hypothetical protein